LDSDLKGSNKFIAHLSQMTF